MCIFLQQEIDASPLETSRPQEPTHQIEVEVESDAVTEDSNKTYLNVNADNLTPRNFAPPKKVKRKRSEACYKKNEDFHALSSVARMPTVMDDVDLFGQMVAQGLRSISDDRQRALCKLKIHQVLFNFQFGPVEEPGQQSQSASTSSASTSLSLMTL